jgi:predicted membrane protein
MQQAFGVTFTVNKWWVKGRHIPVLPIVYLITHSVIYLFSLSRQRQSLC